MKKVKNNIVNMQGEIQDQQSENKNKEMFEQVLASAIKVGNKYFAPVPLRLLFIDDSYQRKTKKTKVAALVKKWDINKMDALRVSPRPENNTFAIIDGSHRYSAAMVKQENILVCELLMDLSSDPKERVKQEAKLYATQSDEVNKLTPIEKHNANVLLGVEENMIVDSILKKYGLLLKQNSMGGKIKQGRFAGFSALLEEAKKGEEHVDRIINVICNIHWDIAHAGTSSLVVRCFGKILSLHKGREDDIKETLISILLPMEPEQLFGKAVARYPMRKERERVLLFLEDEVCRLLKMERVYNGENKKEKAVKTA